MKIQEVHLKNFKRFDDLTIKFTSGSKKIIALVGPNGCGKSSIFDSFLHSLNRFSQIGARVSGHKKSEYFSKGADSGYENNWDKNVIITFDTGNFYTLWQNKTRLGAPNTIFFFRSSYRYSQELNVTQLNSLPDIKENNFGASYSTEIDNKIVSNYQRLYAYINNFRKTNNLTDKEANHQVIGILNDSLEKCLGLKIVDTGEIIESRGTLLFEKSNEPYTFSFNVLSAGEKECVDMLLDIFLKKDTFVDTIYCIDEPELHLNTAIQKKLLIEIEKLIPDTCQLWVATHSIGFLRALQDELKDKAQILDFSEKDYFTGSKTIMPMKPNRKNWQRIFATALEDLTGLIAPKRIVYCEGKLIDNRANIEEGLDAKVYNEIFGETYSDTIFISSGGNTELDQRADVAIAILGKVFSEVEIWVLKDRDMNSGKPVSEEARQLNLQNTNETHRFLKRFEIENYLFDK